MSTEEEIAAVSSPPKKESKKRARNSPGSTDAKKAAKSKSATKRTKKSATTTDSASVGPTPPPTHTLIVDNGGDTLKYGWLQDETPQILPNVTARLAHQITLLVGDEIDRVQNPTSLVAITRSCERGIICNMGNQTQVWKRMLDLLGVMIPLQTDAATALGWKPTKKAQLPARTIPSHAIAVILLLPPHYPRTLIDQINYIWMEDFGVGHIGFGTSSVFAGQEHTKYKTSCTVDLGWSSSIVVPTFKRRAILPEAIQRMPIGGRHLVNILKYHMSYRQYNLMDQERLLTDVLHQLSYVSLEFAKDMSLARLKPSGRRIYDRDFLLPDYQRTTRGQVRIPQALQRDLEAAAKKTSGLSNDDQEEEEEDEDYEMDDDGSDDDHVDEDTEKIQEIPEKAGDDVDEDEDETIEQRRQELLRQRAEEERRRREQAEEEQVLRVSVERFVIPEILFRPADAGFPEELAGLASAIVQAIKTCPDHFHAALYRSIHLVGGISRIENIRERLERDVRELVPVDYAVKIEQDESAVIAGWLGAKSWAVQSPPEEIMISRDEWLTAGKRNAYGRLLYVNSGAFV